MHANLEAAASFPQRDRHPRAQCRKRPHAVPRRLAGGNGYDGREEQESEG